MVKIFGTLPQKFNSLFTAWDSVSETNRTRDNLIEFLIEEGRLLNFEEVINALIAVKIQKKDDSKRNVNNLKKEAQQEKHAEHNRKEMFCHYCYKERSHREAAATRNVTTPGIRRKLPI